MLKRLSLNINLVCFLYRSIVDSSVEYKVTTNVEGRLESMEMNRELQANIS